MKWQGKDGIDDLGRPRILLSTPTLDFKLDVQYVQSVISVLAKSGGSVLPHWLCGNSNVAEARNRIAHYFMRHTPCDVLVCVDADILFRLEDFEFLMEGDEDIVVAPYARKVLGRPPVDFGLGFTRISRAAFQKLADWMAPAPEGETEGEVEALHRYMNDGEMAVDYYFTGASADSRWFGEDAGFFHWCAMNNISMRQEKRCRLGHIGRMVYHYPEQAPGWKAEEDSGQ